MYALSNDPSDLVAIIPGHFLIGEPPVSIPAFSEADDGPQRRYISHFRLVNNLRDHFWRRWSGEYLHHPQQLNKRRKRSDNLSPASARGNHELCREDRVNNTLRGPAAHYGTVSGINSN